MDVQRTSELQMPSRPDPGAERAADLAAARQRLSADGQRSAEAASARRTREIAVLRDVVANAVGADTRVSITRAPTAPIFVYQAIDEKTGEVVQQWPRLDFLGHARLIRSAEPDPAALGDGVNNTA